jgi:iron complex outermembrane receptor protein
MITTKANTRLAMAIALALGTAASGVAGAAEQPAGALEEITVTARKRVENLQDVSTSISALSAAELERRFDADLQSFANAAPNLIIDDIQQGPGSPAAISIRGVGTTDVEKNFDPTVGVVVDGVFIGVNSGAMIKAIDLERIEVLRGPQGTLFGRNSIGGVINVLRGKPTSDAIGGELRLGAGNNGDMQIDGYANFPVSETFALKIGGALRENDGWYYNETLGRESGAMEYKQISPAFSWRPLENLEIYYRFDKTQQDQDANTVLNMAQEDQIFCLAYGECAQGVQTPQSGDRYTVLQNGDGSDDGVPYQSYFDTELHIAHVNWEVNDAYTVNYVFGDFSTDEKVYQDWDGTSRTLYHTDRPATWNQQSHELRLGFTGDKLSYTAGLYYWESDYRIDLMSYIGFGDVLFGLPPGTVLEIPQTVVQNTESTAFFIEGDYKFNDAWTLTLGGRYTKDEKDSGLIDASMPELAVKGSLENPFEEEWNEFTPKASLKYRMNDDVMLYGLYSKGFRAGGFTGRPGTYVAAAIPYDPETVDNFELGWKTEWMDGRLRLNGSVFYMKYDDKQEEQSVPTAGGTGQQTLVVNASSVDIMGLELDFAAIITDNFTIAGNIGLLDAEYQELVDPGTDLGTGDDRDLTYLKLRRAPDYTATISPTYTVDLGTGQLTLQADLRYVDDQELTFLNSPQGQSKAHETIDASLSYRMGDTIIALWGLNLTDDDSWSQAYDVGTSLDFAGLWTYAASRPPRTYGLRLSHKF